MKKFIITAIIVAVSTVCSQAQQTKHLTHGYWVAESNKHTPKVQTIRFYNDDAKLVYEETVTRPVNIKRKKVQMMLNDICENFYQQKQAIEGNKLVTAAFNLER